MSFDQIYAQDKEISDFLEWPSTSNYNTVLIAIIIMIIVGIIANYLWSNRKGRRYSEE
jgi:ABC-type antimicrobial peptide transport system permease subunit